MKRCQGYYKLRYQIKKARNQASAENNIQVPSVTDELVGNENVATNCLINSVDQIATNSLINSVDQIATNSLINSVDQNRGETPDLTKQMDRQSSSFKDSLISWALKNKINNNSLTDLLHLLHSVKSLNELQIPLDSRTLLQTPREKCDIVEMGAGQYYHFGLKTGLTCCLKKDRKLELLSKVVLQIGIDGLPLSKSSTSAFWPILVNITKTEHIFLVGLYYGAKKPTNANEFLSRFAAEAANLIANGIDFENKTLTVEIEAFICDAPAKSFVLNTKGHAGYKSCSKCTVLGEYLNKRMCFPDFTAALRTDQAMMEHEYEGDDYQLSPTILENIPKIGLVSSFPLDYMHLLCLGIMRKLLNLWTKESLSYRLQSRSVNEISRRLDNLKHSVPIEFARKPRSLMFMNQFKATELRQILLYTGPTVFHSILKPRVYNNFLMLHVISRILCSEDLVRRYSNYCEKVIECFLKDFIDIYGAYNVSHNVHGLSHLVGDVLKLGTLDQFSAFKFENYMQKLKKLVRKADKPLQQVVARVAEIEKSTITENKGITADKDINHKSVQHLGFTLKAANGIYVKDNCVLLHDKTVIIIKTLSYNHIDKEHEIEGSKFKVVRDFFTVPCASSKLNIFLVENLLDQKIKYRLKDIAQKCYFVPRENSSAVVIPLLHNNDN